MAAKKWTEIRIVNRRSGKALQAVDTENGAVVAQAELSESNAQLWTAMEVNGGVKIFHQASGKVLDVMQGGVADGTWAQIWEDADGESQLWKVETVSPTYKKLIHALSGKVLDIVDMSMEDGAPAQIWEDVNGENQQWKFVPAQKKTASKTVKKTAEKKPAAPKKAEAKAAVKAEASKKPAALRAEEAPVKPAKKAPAKKPAAKGSKKK